jgi:hypothetical protein
MTKHEARARYGNDWIYWHGPGHCWDNQRGHHRAKRNEADNRRLGRQPDAVVPDKSPSRGAVIIDGAHQHSSKLGSSERLGPRYDGTRSITSSSMAGRRHEPDILGPPAISIWPAPPTDFTWADRWPNQDRISPDRWLMELVQFGSQR